MKYLCCLLLICVLLTLGACRRQEPEKTKPVPDAFQAQRTPQETVHTRPDPDAVVPGRELLRSVESLEEAERLAECYGITLVEYIDGLAVFTTEEDPRDVIQRGRDNGWPELSRNSVRKLS